LIIEIELVNNSMIAHSYVWAIFLSIVCSQDEIKDFGLHNRHEIISVLQF